MNQVLENYIKFNRELAENNEPIEYKRGDVYINAEYLGNHKTNGKYIIKVDDEILVVDEEELRMNVVKKFRYRNYLAFNGYPGQRYASVHVIVDDNSYFHGNFDELVNSKSFIQWVGGWQEITADFIKLLEEKK